MPKRRSAPADLVKWQQVAVTLAEFLNNGESPCTVQEESFLDFYRTDKGVCVLPKWCSYYEERDLCTCEVTSYCRLPYDSKQNCWLEHAKDIVFGVNRKN